jgi:parallel beta-helix repeat protein
MIPTKTKIIVIFILLLLFCIQAVGAITCPLFLEEDYGITGNGLDEGAKLKAAFTDATNNPPCKIIFPKNKIIVFNNTLSLGPNIEIFGNGSTLKLQDGWDNAGFALSLGDHDYIHDLKLDGNIDNVPSHPNEIFLNDWVRFENNELFNVSAYTVTSYNSDNWIFKNNYIHDGNQYAIAMQGHYPFDTSNNVTVQNNTLENFKEIGVKIRGCTNSTVSNNTIILLDGAGVSAIGIAYTDGISHNVIVSNNTIFGDLTNSTPTGTTTGIYSDFHEHTGMIITNNIINSTYRGIFLVRGDALVFKNSISNSRYSGLESVGNGSKFYGNTLTNAGIIVGQTRGSNNNIFRYNSITSGNNYWRADGDGAFLWYNGTGNIFDFNYFYVDDYGFNINDDFGIIYNTSITNNTIIAGNSCYLDKGVSTIFINNTCNGVTELSMQSGQFMRGIPSGDSVPSILSLSSDAITFYDISVYVVKTFIFA